MQITNFESTQNALTEYAPVNIQVAGKTLTERKLSVIPNASLSAQVFLSNAGGKIGKTARQSLTDQGTQMIAKNARAGNYKPMAEAIAGLTGESISISSRAGFESLQDRFEDKLFDLSLSKNHGYTFKTLTKDDPNTGKKEGDQIRVPSAKRKMFNDVIGLITEVQAIIKTLG